MNLPELNPQVLAYQALLFLLVKLGNKEALALRRDIFIQQHIYMQHIYIQSRACDPSVRHDGSKIDKLIKESQYIGLPKDLFK